MEDTQDTKVDKRIVLLTTTGPLAGLHQIMGMVSVQVEAMGQLDDFIPNVKMPDGRTAPVGLVQFKPRYVLYKEVNGPQMQRFDTYNPSQR